MKNFKSPQEALKYHVTGAIERGEKQAIVAKKPVATKTPQVEAIPGMTPLGINPVKDAGDGQALKWREGANKEVPMKTNTQETQNTKHTPGPWRSFSATSAAIVIAAAQTSLATIHKNLGNPALMDRDGEGEANAALIAASPELLEALKKLASDYEESSGIDRKEFEADSQFMGRHHAGYALALAAIAKAEGRAS